MLEGLRKACSNKNSVTFAILNGTTTTQQAFKMGVNFVLQKPISTLNATRCFSAALNFMIREQRRYFRHPVEIPAHATVRGRPEDQGDNHQYQRRGHGHLFPGQVSPRAAYRQILPLTGVATPLEPKVQLAWMDDSGRAGLQFFDLAKDLREQLDQWLTEQCKNAERRYNQTATN